MEIPILTLQQFVDIFDENEFEIINFDWSSPRKHWKVVLSL